MPTLVPLLLFGLVMFALGCLVMAWAILGAVWMGDGEKGPESGQIPPYPDSDQFR